MATKDISRLLFDSGKHYSSVRMQQGRVMIDSDWNENESTNLLLWSVSDKRLLTTAIRLCCSLCFLKNTLNRRNKMTGIRYEKNLPISLQSKSIYSLFYSLPSASFSILSSLV